MLFNSFAFLAFFAVVAGVHYGLPPRLRWIWLLAASLFFYATYGLVHLALLLGVTLISYSAAVAIAAAPSHSSKKWTLAGSIIIVLGVLFFFKYYNFFRQSADEMLGGVMPAAIAGLPRFDLAVIAGLSFYTFSCISYVADVYLGRANPERNIGRFALYTAFFPKLLAGPLERTQPFLDQVDRPAPFIPSEVTAGLQQMLWGLFKKIVIADRLAAFVDGAYQLPSLTSPADLLLATYFFAFQLYCDFSGYSDIAIGAAKVLGFDLMVNFRRPYLSTSVREFWAGRWHLSLSAWFRDYLYIPLGGSRVRSIRQYVNVMVVFLVSGLWHGANWTFVIWGGLNGAYQVLSLGYQRVRGGNRVGRPAALTVILARVVTFHLVLVTWVFFRAASLADATDILTRVASSAPRLPALLRTRLASDEVLLSIGFIVLLLVVEVIDEHAPMWDRLRIRPVYVRWAVYYGLLIALVVFGRWSLQQFVYMQF